jgi:hypothetical protein
MKAHKEQMRAEMKVSHEVMKAHQEKMEATVTASQEVMEASHEKTEIPENYNWVPCTEAMHLLTTLQDQACSAWSP